MSDGKFVVAYKDYGNLEHGTAVAMKANTPLGIAGEDATSGESVPVILDGISDVHSGLTPWQTYYAGDNGALAMEGDGLNPKIGRALSTTELLLKIE